MLQFQRFQAKKLAPPTLQRRGFAIIVRGDGFKVFHRRDHLGGNAVALAHLTQQNFQQFHGRATTIRAAVAVDFRQRLRITRQTTLNRRQNLDSSLGAFHAAREGAQIAKRFRRARRRQRDFDQNIVFQNARTRHILRLRLKFAPGAQVHQHREIAGFAGAVAETLPRMVRVLLIGRGRGEGAHLVGEPRQTARLFQLLQQKPIDVTQMCHVSDGIIRLCIG